MSHEKKTPPDTATIREVMEQQTPEETGYMIMYEAFIHLSIPQQAREENVKRWPDGDWHHQESNDLGLEGEIWDSIKRSHQK